VLGPQDVGFRVVVRRVVGERDGRPQFSDVLGDLTAFGDGTLTVASRRGPVTVPLSDVVAGKRIPPRPVPPRREVPDAGGDSDGGMGRASGGRPCAASRSRYG